MKQNVASILEHHKMIIFYHQNILFHKEHGRRRRGFMVGIGKYAGRGFKNLSVTPLNDIKLMSTTLKNADYCLENSYENVKSKEQFENILDAYVDSMNRNAEEIGKKTENMFCIVDYTKLNKIYYFSMFISM